MKKTIYLTILALFLTFGCQEKKNSDLLLPLLGGGVGSVGDTELVFNGSNNVAAGIQTESLSSIRSIDPETKKPIVIKPDNTIQDAFNSGRIKVDKLFRTSNGDLITLLQFDKPLVMREERGKSYLPATINKPDNFKFCVLLISESKNNSTKCLDYDFEMLMNDEITVDSQNNIYVFGIYKNLRQLVIYNSERKKSVFLQGDHLTIYKMKILAPNDFIIYYRNGSFENTRFYLERFTDGVATTIWSQPSYAIYHLDIFPDGNLYYAHNSPDHGGSGFAKYDMTTGVNSAYSTVSGNWENLSVANATNFTTSGTRYTVSNSGKVFHNAMAQTTSAHPNYQRSMMYQMYPKIRTLDVDTLFNIDAIYGVDGANEFLIVGRAYNSSLYEVRLMNGSTYAVRSVSMGTMSKLPSVSVNNETKRIEVLDGNKIHRFEFSTGNGVYSLINLNLQLDAILSL